jgi:hypothetical protein
MHAVRTYFAELSSTFGAAWNRFWFTARTAALLGVMRVLVGAMAFYTIATFGPDLDRWFGPGGMLPAELVRNLYEHQWSILDSLPPRMLWPAFYVALAAIALLTLGIGGRLAAIAATFATLSFFTRAPMTTGEFEPVLALLLVYLCVGRAGDAYSVPALLRRRRGRPGALPSSPQSLASPTNTIALRLLQIHIALVHLMMACAMLSAPESAWWNGEGLYLAATRPGMALVDLSFLADHPRVVAAWSHLATIYLLTFAALVWSRWARPLVLAVGFVVWISIAIASGWLMFSLAMLTGLIAFLARD